MSIDECRIKEFFLFYLLKIAERSDIHNSSFDIHNSSFDKVSYEVSGEDKAYNTIALSESGFVGAVFDSAELVAGNRD
jgi:hypothetical protein